jgi:hypothetical protein
MKGKNNQHCNTQQRKRKQSWTPALDPITLLYLNAAGLAVPVSDADISACLLVWENMSEA